MWSEHDRHKAFSWSDMKVFAMFEELWSTAQQKPLEIASTVCNISHTPVPMRLLVSDANNRGHPSNKQVFEAHAPPQSPGHPASRR